LVPGPAAEPPCEDRAVTGGPGINMSSCNYRYLETDVVFKKLKES